MSSARSRWLRRTVVATALIAVGGLLPGSAQAAPVDLLTNANVRLDGAAASDNSGTSLAGAGDVNGDGRDDVIIGAKLADNNGRSNSGSSVIFGAATTVTTSTVVVRR